MLENVCISLDVREVPRLSGYKNSVMVKMDLASRQLENSQSLSVNSAVNGYLFQTRVPHAGANSFC